MSLVRAGSANPAIDAIAFPNTPAEPFWTASPYTASMGYAWTVFFSNIGGSYYYQTSNAYRVRCVR
jgi:hypothetical protein